jgi:transcriptional regulator with XRE-family HTH domain
MAVERSRDRAADADPDVGGRIREMRLARGMKLNHLAAEASLSPGGLSQIESGSIQPSLTTLRRIAAALGEPIFKLFVTPDVEPEIVVRASERRKVIGASGTAYELLTPSLRGALEVIELRLAPGEVSAETRLGHPGEECMIVIQGRAKLEFEDAQFDLDVGDAATYDGKLPHRIHSIGDTDLVSLSAITPPAF